MTKESQNNRANENNVGHLHESVRCPTLEERFLRLVTDAGLPEPLREYRFDPLGEGRKWRVDFCWPEWRVCVEIDGEIAHRGWRNMASDREKTNIAQLTGWIMLRFTGKMITKEWDRCINYVEMALKRNGYGNRGAFDQGQRVEK